MTQGTAVPNFAVQRDVVAGKSDHLTVDSTSVSVDVMWTVDEQHTQMKTVEDIKPFWYDLVRVFCSSRVHILVVAERYQFKEG